MPLNLAFGTLSLPINNLNDLETAVENATNLQVLASLLPNIEDFYTNRLADLPDNFTASIGYTSGTNTWSPGGGALKFTLSGGSSGSLSVVKSGELFSSTTSFPITMGDGLSTAANANNTTHLKVPENSVYLKVSLQFQIAGGASGSYTSGIYGIDASVGGSSTLFVEFLQLCTDTTTLKDALTLAFQGFVLPLHPQTFEKLKGRANCYLHYSFNAKLQVGFGGSIGMPTFSYAAEYKGAVGQLGNALGVNAAFKPSVSAGVALNFAGDYTGAFETVVWVDDAGMGHLHLFRAKTQSNSVGLTANLNATPGLSAQAQLNSGVALAALTNSLTDNLQLQAALASLFSTYTGQIDSWANELNSKVAAWLKPVNSLNCSLDATISQLNDTFMLADYTIDLTKPYAGAWQHMIDCRFYDAVALANSGVTLSAGSGLEHIYNVTGTMHLNLFGKFDAMTSTQFAQDAKLIYAGNNVFHLSVDTGRQQITTINGSTKEIDLYFASEVDLTDVAAPIADINLHFILQAVNNTKFAKFVANAVQTLVPTATPQNLQLVQTVRAISALPNTTEMLHAKFTPDAYALLQATNLKSVAPDWSSDRNNFNAFVLACQHMQVSPYNNQPYNFRFMGEPITYETWAAINVAAKDDGSPVANRRASMNYTNVAGPALPLLRNYFPGLPIDIMSAIGDLARLNNLFQVVAGFMNLVDDLKGLATMPLEATSATWQSAVQQLATIMKKDTDADFMPPAGLAIAYLCGVHPKTVVGPVSSLPAGTSIAVQLTF